MSKDKHDWIVGFVGACRCPQSIFEFAAELANLGQHGSDVPRANAQHWKRVIEDAVKDGVLIEDGSGIRVPIEEATPKQLTLF